MLHENKFIKNVIIASLLSLPAALAGASEQGGAMQLKTSQEEVNGVRDIESGDYQNGIRKTQAALNLLTVPSQRAPLLTNLCVAHIATKNFEHAKQACNESVSSSQSSEIALNNRAVLHFITGNVEASLNDLQKAANGNRYQNLVASNLQVLNQHELLAKH